MWKSNIFEVTVTQFSHKSKFLPALIFYRGLKAAGPRMEEDERSRGHKLNDLSDGGVLR